jgi:hypothetical protein
MASHWRITTKAVPAHHRGTSPTLHPFGTIAGMIQYEHASVAAIEGYARTSASGFRAEVEAQCQHRDKNGPGTGLKRGQLG